jgi:hypothetical protein
LHDAAVSAVLGNSRQLGPVPSMPIDYRAVLQSILESESYAGTKKTRCCARCRTTGWSQNKMLAVD